MQADGDKEDALLCVRDSTPVGGDAPKCLHPSGYCEFRDCCQVREAQRRRTRPSGRDDRD